MLPYCKNLLFRHELLRTSNAFIIFQITVVVNRVIKFALRSKFLPHYGLNFRNALLNPFAPGDVAEKQVLKS